MWTGTGEQAYLAASASGATRIGLLGLVYSAIAADLCKAGESARRGDIIGRCAASNHALALLGHVEGWELDASDHALQRSLLLFYSVVRAQIIGLQARGSDQDFYRLAGLVSEVRATWQQREQELIDREIVSRHSEPAESEHPPAQIQSLHNWCA